MDYQKLSVVLWGVVKSLQKRVDKLEKKKRAARINVASSINMSCQKEDRVTLDFPAHGLAQGLAQLPGSLHVLGDEAELVAASADAVVVLRLHRIEEPLDVLLRHAPDVRLEPPVRGRWP